MCNVFSTGLVRFDIAGLPLRSCWIIGPPSEGGGGDPPNIRFCVHCSSGTRTHVLSLTRQTHYRYAMLIPHIQEEEVLRVNNILLYLI